MRWEGAFFTFEASDLVWGSNCLGTMGNASINFLWVLRGGCCCVDDAMVGAGDGGRGESMIADSSS